MLVSAPVRLTGSSGFILIFQSFYLQMSLKSRFMLYEEFKSNQQSIMTLFM